MYTVDIRHIYLGLVIISISKLDFTLSPCCECCIFFVGDSLASEFNVRRFGALFRLNTSCDLLVHTTYEDERDRLFRNVGT